MAISQNPPVTNQRAAEKNKAANTILMQDQFKAGSAPKDSSTLQKLGAAFTGQQMAQDVAATGAEAASEVANIERDRKSLNIEQSEQNRKDRERLTKSIEDQKNKIIQMNIGIDEDSFADSLMIRQLQENQQFANDTQVADLARLTFESDEDYRNILQASNQRMQQKQKELEWQLDTFNQALKDKQLSQKIAKDTALEAEIRLARDRVKEDQKRLQKKMAKNQAAMGVLKTGAGVAMMFNPLTAPAGAGILTSGAGDVFAASQA